MHAQSGPHWRKKQGKKTKKKASPKKQTPHFARALTRNLDPVDVKKRGKRRGKKEKVLSLTEKRKKKNCSCLAHAQPGPYWRLKRGKREEKRKEQNCHPKKKKKKKNCSHLAHALTRNLDTIEKDARKNAVVDAHHVHQLPFVCVCMYVFIYHFIWHTSHAPTAVCLCMYVFIYLYIILFSSCL